MRLSEKDNQSLIEIYEAVISNKNRFAGVNPQVAEIIKSAEKKISWAIKNVQMNDVFFATQLNKMIPDNKNDMVRMNINTMSTDGKNLFYNPEYVNSLPLETVETVIVHEILHISLGHHLAFAHIDPKNQNIWHIVNIACDLALNYLIKDRAGFIEGGLLLAGQGTYKDFPLNLNARQYFDLLIKKYTPPEENEPEQPNEPESGDQPQDDENQGEDTQPSDGTNEDDGEKGDEQGDDSGEGKPDDTGDDSDDGEGGESDAEGEDGTKEGTGKGGSGSATDEESEDGDGDGIGEIDTEELDKKIKERKDSEKAPKAAKPTKSQDEVEDKLEIPQDIIDQYKKVGEITKPKDIDIKNQNVAIEQNRKEMQEDAISADEMEKRREEQGIHSQGYGSGSDRLVDSNYRKLFEQKSNLPWRQILAEFLSLPSKSELTYSRQQPRFSEFARESGIIIPGWKGQKLGEISFLVDVSGSMPRKACEKVFGELSTISKEKMLGQNAIIRLLSFDDGLKSEDVFSSQGGNIPSVRGKGVKVDKSHTFKLPIDSSVFKTFRWVSGGGGTNIINSLQALAINLPTPPKVVIILTDGYFGTNEIQYLNNTKFPYKIIWLMTTDVKFAVGHTYTLAEYNYDLSRY